MFYALQYTTLDSLYVQFLSSFHPAKFRNDSHSSHKSPKSCTPRVQVGRQTTVTPLLENNVVPYAVAYCDEYITANTNNWPRNPALANRNTTHRRRFSCQRDSQIKSRQPYKAGTEAFSCPVFGQTGPDALLHEFMRDDEKIVFILCTSCILRKRRKTPQKSTSSLFSIAS